MTKQSENLSILLLKVREKAISYVRPILASLDLTEQQWRVIRTLAELDVVTTQVLAENSCILGPSLSRILSKLEADKIILRKPSGEDHRVVNIKLSSKGKRLHANVYKKIEKQYIQFNEDHGKENVERLSLLLQEFIN